jgi:hypothetical protein
MNCNIISIPHFTNVDNIPFHYIPSSSPQCSLCLTNEKSCCADRGSDYRSEGNISSWLAMLNLVETVLRFFGICVVVC